jgi:hypothetical protein
LNFLKSLLKGAYLAVILALFAACSPKTDWGRIATHQDDGELTDVVLENDLIRVKYAREKKPLFYGGGGRGSSSLTAMSRSRLFFFPSVMERMKLLNEESHLRTRIRADRRKCSEEKSRRKI